jgi:hypothetical protein
MGWEMGMKNEEEKIRVMALYSFWVVGLRV